MVVKYDLKEETRSAGFSLIAGCLCVIGTIGYILCNGAGNGVYDRIAINVGFLGSFIGVCKFVKRSG